MVQCFGILVIATWLGTAPSPAADPTYWQDVRPILRKYCTACHNARYQGEPEVSGGLALDTYQALLSAKKPAALVPGKSANSPIVERIITADIDKRMPPAASPLPEDAVAVLRRWIDSGTREGERPREGTTAAIAKAPARSRKLDIVLSTNAGLPRTLTGQIPPGKLELSLPAGPLAPVTALAFSPDGKTLAMGAYGGVTLWNLETVRPARMLTSILGAVNDLKFRPDGQMLAVGGGQPSAKGDLRLFSVSDGKLVANLPGHQDVVFGLSFSPDGKSLASASFDKTVRLWDLATHKPRLTLTGHSDFVYAVLITPDGQWLISASKDRTVKYLETATGKSRFTFSGMNDDVLAVAVSPDGKQVVSSGHEPALVWWNPQTGERVRSQGGHGGPVHELCFSKDGRILASASGDRTVRLWQGTSGTALRTIPVGSVVYTVALSPDGKRLASGSFDGLTRLWDVATGRLLATLLALPSSSTASSWLALTPEGYVIGSSDLIAAGKWQMSGRALERETFWKVLDRPELLARAVRGETVPLPTFDKPSK